MFPLAKPLNRSNSDEVYARLVEAVSTGQIRAGERLPPEEQLAAHFEVATMTLRQALAQLRNDGYVVTTRGRTGGTRVAENIAELLEEHSRDRDVTVADLRMLTDWRRAVSGEASFLAAVRATDEERRTLQQLAEEYHSVVAVTTERRLADARLHLHIARMSGNPRLIAAEREIQDQLTRFIRVTPRKGIELVHAEMEHQDLTEAIIRQDAEAARRALLEHVEITYSWGTKQPSVIGHTPPTPRELAQLQSVRGILPDSDLTVPSLRGTERPGDREGD